MSDLDKVVLAADEFLLIKPKNPTPELLAHLNEQLPAELRGRVLVFAPDLDIQVVKLL